MYTDGQVEIEVLNKAIISEEKCSQLLITPANEEIIDKAMQRFGFSADQKLTFALCQKHCGMCFSLAKDPKKLEKLKRK